jgi:hypothetical protein
MKWGNMDGACSTHGGKRNAGKIMPRSKCGKNRLSICETMVLGKIFGRKVTGEWSKLHNEELYELFAPNIIRVDKSTRMELAGHVARDDKFMPGFDGET